MSIIAALRDRAQLLRNEASEIDRRIVALRCRDYRDSRVAAVTRLRAFLAAFSPMSFRVAELIEAVGGTEASVRKALWRLARANLVERVAGRRWRAPL